MTDPTGTTVTDTGPLDWRIGIVDSQGRPTPEFQRRWNTQRNNNGLITTVTVGTGAPSGTPASDGDEYIDIGATPPTLYVGSSGAWVKVGVYTFLQLSDTPSTYTGEGSAIVQVNSGGTALVFTGISAILDLLGSAEGDILYRGATGWVSLAPGTAGYVLSTNGAGAIPSWVAQSGGGGGGGNMLPLVNGDKPGVSAIADGQGMYIGVPL